VSIELAGLASPAGREANTARALHHGIIMFKKGDVFDNPVTGERATILLGTRETRGERLVVELELQGTGFGSPLHKHPSIHERLKVESGRVGVIIHDSISIVEPGKMIEIGPGVPHRFWNAGITSAKLTLDIRPAKRFEAFIRNMIGLAQDGKTDPMGMPNLLQLAAIASQFSDVIQFMSPPRLVQNVLFPVLAPIAAMRGYKGSYSEYVFRSPSRRIQLETKTPLWERI
jgi:mannose-6-phosphate isomerase-like protein (cupin superfamily)